MASKQQREIMDQWYGHTGFEFMQKYEVRATDPQGFLDAWKDNVQWLQDVVTEADSIIKEYRDAHDEESEATG